MALDTKDRAILSALQEDARMSHTAIAARVGLTQPAVLERIRRLEHRGIILGYHTQLDPDALGRPVTAFIGVTTTAVAPEDEARMTRMPDVLEVHHVAGDECFLLKVRVASPRDLEDLLRRLRAIPGITKTRTTIVLSTRLERLSIALPEEPAPQQVAS
jgi:Lrp/AsnC family leucine-responsive transcriptional regulator